MDILSYYKIVSSFIKKVIDFISHPTHSRTMGILIFFVLLAAVSLTVYVAQQQQQIRQRAADLCADTTINECPPGVGVIAGNTCANPDFKCKIGNTIFECAEQK